MRDNLAQENFMTDHKALTLTRHLPVPIEGMRNGTRSRCLTNRLANSRIRIRPSSRLR